MPLRKEIRDNIEQAFALENQFGESLFIRALMLFLETESSTHISDFLEESATIVGHDVYDQFEREIGEVVLYEVKKREALDLCIRLLRKKEIRAKIFKDISPSTQQEHVELISTYLAVVVDQLIMAEVMMSENKIEELVNILHLRVVGKLQDIKDFGDAQKNLLYKSMLRNLLIVIYRLHKKTIEEKELLPQVVTDIVQAALKHVYLAPLVRADILGEEENEEPIEVKQGITNEYLGELVSYFHSEFERVFIKTLQEIQLENSIQNLEPLYYVAESILEFLPLADLVPVFATIKKSEAIKKVSRAVELGLTSKGQPHGELTQLVEKKILILIHNFYEKKLTEFVKSGQLSFGDVVAIITDLLASVVKNPVLDLDIVPIESDDNVPDVVEVNKAEAARIARIMLPYFLDTLPKICTRIFIEGEMKKIHPPEQLEEKVGAALYIVWMTVPAKNVLHCFIHESEDDLVHSLNLLLMDIREKLRRSTDLEHESFQKDSIVRKLSSELMKFYMQVIGELFNNEETHVGTKLRRGEFKESQLGFIISTAFQSVMLDPLIKTQVKDFCR